MTKRNSQHNDTYVNIQRKKNDFMERKIRKENAKRKKEKPNMLIQNTEKTLC